MINRKIEISKEYRVIFQIYPFNLSLCIFKDETKALHVHIDKLIEVVDLLETKERDIIQKRFIDNKTQRIISKEYGVSIARITQIQALAISSLKKMKENYISIPEIEVKALKSVNNRLEIENKRLKLALKELKTQEFNMDEVTRLAEHKLLMDTPIEDLKLRPRPYLALKRNQISSLREICQYTYEELKFSIKVGDISAHEIVKALEPYGLELAKK